MSANEEIIHDQHNRVPFSLTTESASPARVDLITSPDRTSPELTGQLSVECLHLSKSHSTSSFLATAKGSEMVRITPNDINILLTLAIYRVCCRPQIQRFCFPHHASGRATRRHLCKLHRAGFIAKTNNLIPYSNYASGAPAWYLTKDGARLLHEHFDDPHYLTLNTRAPREDRIHHWVSIADSHFVIQTALENNPQVRLHRWVNEWETLPSSNGHTTPAYVLNVVFSAEPPKLSCSPDAGFVLETNDNQRMVYLLEQCRGTSGARQTITSKVKGFDKLHETRAHRQMFPEATIDSFRVLMVTTTAGRRSALIRELQNQPSKELWLLTTVEDLTVDKFPHGSVFYDWQGNVGPLIHTATQANATAG